jgi:uncharacterized protein
MRACSLGLAAVLLIAALDPNDAVASSNSCGQPATRVEHLICTSATLRKLDAELGRMYDAVEGETRGMDGETGKVIDPFGKEHQRWLATTRNRCRTTTCLAGAYQGRIAYVKRHWADAL